MTDMLILKWIETFMLKYKNIDDDVDSDDDNEIGIGNGEES